MNRGKNLLVNRKSEGLNLHFPRYISNDHIHRSSAHHAFFPGKIIGHIDGEERIFFVRENFLGLSQYFMLATAAADCAKRLSKRIDAHDRTGFDWGRALAIHNNGDRFWPLCLECV